MQIDPDVTSIHRGLPSSNEELVREAPSLNDSDPHRERRPRSFIASVLARSQLIEWLIGGDGRSLLGAGAAAWIQVVMCESE
jgi:hypothetical protein